MPLQTGDDSRSPSQRPPERPWRWARPPMAGIIGQLAVPQGRTGCFSGDAGKFVLVTAVFTIVLAMLFSPLYVSGSFTFGNYIQLLIMQVIGFVVLWGTAIIFALILAAAQNRNLPLPVMAARAV